MKLRQTRSRAGRDCRATLVASARALRAAPSTASSLPSTAARAIACTATRSKAATDSGNVGPPLVDMKARFPDRKDVVAIISDETKRNPQTVMPPFGRNLILTEQEIEAIVDFLYTQ